MTAREAAEKIVFYVLEDEIDNVTDNAVVEQTTTIIQQAIDNGVRETLGKARKQALKIAADAKEERICLAQAEADAEIALNADAK